MLLASRIYPVSFASLVLMLVLLTGVQAQPTPSAEPAPASTVETPTASIIIEPAKPGEAEPAAPTAATALPEAVVEPPPFETKVVPVPQAEDLWQRIRRGFRMNDLATPLAEDRTQWYARQPDYVKRMTDRSSRYLFHIVEELERRNMPTELALLPFIESAFNPQAYSSAKAAGMWQFIPSTGKQYKLK